MPEKKTEQVLSPEERRHRLRELAGQLETDRYTPDLDALARKLLEKFPQLFDRHGRGRGRGTTSDTREQ